MRASLIIIFIMLIMLSCTVAVKAQDHIEEFLFDVVVTFINPDGWEIVAKDGWQVSGNIRIYVYTNQPGQVSVTAVVDNEKILDVKEDIEFKREYSLSIPETKYGKTLTITVIMTWGRISKTVVKSFTIVKSPVPVRQTLFTFTIRQVQEMLSEAKWDSILKALLAALAGLGVAIFLKYKALMLDPINALQLPLIGAASAVAFLADPDHGAGYFLIFLLSDFMSYRYLKGPTLIGILDIRVNNRRVWDMELPIYSTEEGKLAVALQRSDWAIRRLLGKHVYLEFTGKIDELWKKNEYVDLIVAEKAELKEKEVEEIFENEEMEELRPERRKRKVWVFEITPADAHTLEFIENAEEFEKLKEEYLELLGKYQSLALAFERKVEEAKAKAIEDVIRTLEGGEVFEQ